MLKKSLKEEGIGVYEPENKIDIKKENALPFFSYVGSKLMDFGGFLTLFISACLGTISGFFVAKRKIREVQMKNERVLDLRRNQKRKLDLR